MINVVETDFDASAPIDLTAPPSRRQQLLAKKTLPISLNYLEMYHTNSNTVKEV